MKNTMKSSMEKTMEKTIEKTMEENIKGMNFNNVIKFDVADDFNEEIATSLRSLYSIMIAQILTESRRLLSAKEISDRMMCEYSYLLMDEAVDINTLNRNLKDLVSADYLSYDVYSVYMTGDSFTEDMTIRYGIRANTDIKPISGKLNNRMKPACIYDILCQNMGEAMSAKEISDITNNKISEKTVRDTLNKNLYYTDSNNFFFSVDSDEFITSKGRLVTKFIADYSRLSKIAM